MPTLMPTQRSLGKARKASKEARQQPCFGVELDCNEGGYPQTMVDLVVVAGAKAVEDPCLGDVLVLVCQLPQDPAGREE